MIFVIAHAILGDLHVNMHTGLVIIAIGAHVGNGGKWSVMMDTVGAGNV